MLHCFTESEFEKLSDAEKNSLTFLRGLRDGLAKVTLANASFRDDAEKDIEEMMGMFGGCAYHRLSRRFCDNEQFTYANELKGFRKVCERIGELERAAVKRPLAILEAA